MDGGEKALILLTLATLFFFTASPSDRSRAECLQFPGGPLPLHLPVPTGHPSRPHGDGDVQHPGPVTPPQRHQSGPAGQHWAERLHSPRSNIRICWRLMKRLVVFSISMTEMWEGTRVLSEPHTMLDALYLYNRDVIDEETYNNLLMNIIKIHIAGVDTEGNLDCVVIKPMFKCTPQMKIIKERWIYYLTLSYQSVTVSMSVI